MTHRWCGLRGRWCGSGELGAKKPSLQREIPTAGRAGSRWGGASTQREAATGGSGPPAVGGAPTQVETAAALGDDHRNGSNGQNCCGSQRNGFSFIWQETLQITPSEQRNPTSVSSDKRPSTLFPNQLMWQPLLRKSTMVRQNWAQVLAEYCPRPRQRLLGKTRPQDGRRRPAL